MPALSLIFILIAAVFVAPVASAQGADPSELFLSAYMAVQQAEKLERDEKHQEALTKLRFAGSLLDQIRQRHGDWQPLIVDYRRKKTSEAIGRLEQRLAREVTPAPAQPTLGRDLLPEVQLDESLPSLSDPVRPGTPELPQGLVLEPLPNADVMDLTPREIRSRIEQLQQELDRSRQQLTEVQQEKESLVTRLDATQRQLEKSDRAEAELQMKLEDAQGAFDEAQTDTTQDSESRAALEADVAKLQEALADVRADRDAADELREQLAGRLRRARERAREADETQVELAEARKQIDDVMKERDGLAEKLSKSQDQVATVAGERDVIARERDEALVALTKAREAQQQVDSLMAENSALLEKLTAAEATIQQFNTDMPKKDEEIAQLRGEVTTVREQLVLAQQESERYKTTMAELQTQLDAAGEQLAAAKLNAGSSEELQQFARENELLRGVVLRELKEQARRGQAKRLIVTELQRLQVQSETLMEHIDYLSQPVLKLTEQEKALFKDPQVATVEEAPSTVSISIAAAKNDTEGPAAPAPITDGAAEPAAPPSAAATAQADAAVATDTHVGAAVTGGNTVPAQNNHVANADDALPTGGMDGSGEALQAKGDGAPQVETSVTPNVPEELMSLAQEATGHYQRRQFREAEKVYEKMLSRAPNNVYTLANLGVVRYRAGKLKLSEEAFKKALAVAPEDSFSRCTLGMVYYLQGNYDEAVKELTKAIATNPKNPMAHNYLGITASQKGWQEAARKELETAIALDPKYADAHFNLAVVFATQQPPEKELAKRYYLRAVELGAEPDPALEQLTR